jgi:hypothetical protein
MVQEQLKFWEDECAFARRIQDVARIERCEHFIQQCHLAISALEDAAQKRRIGEE